jgi:hypothetical protein
LEFHYSETGWELETRETVGGSFTLRRLWVGASNTNTVCGSFTLERLSRSFTLGKLWVGLYTSETVGGMGVIH